MATAYLEKYGQLTLDHGYAICAIRPGEKRPFGRDWEAKKFGPKTIAAFIENDRGDFGVGIKTARTPGVDIDCYDEKIVKHMIAYTTELLGEGLERVGLAPKTLLVYRADKPFPKTQSKVFIDDEGRAVKLEVLADGQQFVAFHIHPDTGKPYRWKDKRHVANVARSELPVIDQDDALLLSPNSRSWHARPGGPRSRQPSGSKAARASTTWTIRLSRTKPRSRSATQSFRRSSPWCLTLTITISGSMSAWRCTTNSMAATRA